jgi:hypothetical protein
VAQDEDRQPGSTAARMKGPGCHRADRCAFIAAAERFRKPHDFCRSNRVEKTFEKNLLTGLEGWPYKPRSATPGLAVGLDLALLVI